MSEEKPYAGFLIRLIAFALDAFIFLVIGITLFFIQMMAFPYAVMPETLGLDFGINSNTFGALLITQLIVIGIVMLPVTWLYSAVLESSSVQGTVGKQAVRLVVSDTGGRRISFLRASLRFIGKILSALPFFLGFLLIAVTGKKQGLHDKMAGTVVLQALSSPDDQGPNVPASTEQATLPVTTRSSNLAWYIIIGCVVLLFTGPIILSGIILLAAGNAGHASGTGVPAGSGPGSIPPYPTPGIYWDPELGSRATTLPPDPWQRTADQTPFQRRSSYTVTVFHDKLWVIGGVGTNDPANDVWYSEDGEHWYRATPAAPFMPRFAHAAVVYDDRLWVVGGYGRSKDGSFDSRLNDVWYSTDGVSWTQATPSAAFSPRYFLSMATFAGRIWVIGGYGNDHKNYNDVWYSTDGVSWTQATGSAPFVPRSDANVIGSGSLLWVIGGNTVYGRVYDSWYSPDGRDWTMASPLPFSPANSQSLVAVNGTFWALQDELLTTGIQVRGMWHSADGKHWTEQNPPPGYSKPFHFKEGIVYDEYRMVFFKDRLWVFREYVDTDGSVKNDVWSAPVSSLEHQPPQARFMASTTYGPAPLSVSFTDLSLNRPARRVWDFGDGTISDEKNPAHVFTAAGKYLVSLTVSNTYGNQTGSRVITVDAPVEAGKRWTLATSNPAFDPRSGFPLVEHHGRMWITGGSNYIYDFNDVWYSSDGVQWTPAAKSAAFSPRSGHTLLSFNGRLWVIGGLGHNEEGFYKKVEVCNNDVWYSPDGATWTQATADAGFAPRCDHMSVVYDNKMWVIGGRGIRDGKNPAVQYNDVWYSSDGVTWTRATPAAAFSPRDESTAFVFDNAMWVFGSHNDEEFWRSNDGITWIRKPNKQTLKQFYGRSPVVLVYDNRIWLMQDTSFGSASSSPVWYSKDGSNWTKFNPEFSSVLPKGSYIESGVVFSNRMWIFGDNDVWYSGP